MILRIIGMFGLRCYNSLEVLMGRLGITIMLASCRLRQPHRGAGAGVG